MPTVLHGGGKSIDNQVMSASITGDWVEKRGAYAQQWDFDGDTGDHVGEITFETCWDPMDVAEGNETVKEIDLPKITVGSGSAVNQSEITETPAPFIRAVYTRSSGGAAQYLTGRCTPHYTETRGQGL